MQHDDARGAPSAISKSLWAYRTARTMILSGALPPGFPIDQQALATQLGISTTPLREALRRLEAEAYVISVDHREMRVAPVSVKDVEEIYSVRMRLYPMVARLACANVTTAEIRAIRAYLPSDDENSDYEPTVANRAFHRALYAASGNRALAQVLEGLWDRCERYRIGMQGDEGLIHEAESVHAEIVRLLVEGDEEALAAVLHAHLEDSLGHIRRHLGESPAAAS
jgi:DNA-binding GntR family transcriptional regulator